jgi:hypothetical protein
VVYGIYPDIVSFKNLCETYIETNKYGKYTRLTNLEIIIDSLDSFYHSNGESKDYGDKLAMLDEISKEKVPIILDEAFAYYDNERLKNILNYLTTEFSDRQIIILTCTKREKEILEELGKQFNYIMM